MLIIRSLLVLAALALPALAPPVAAETFSGRVRVIDGDSLAVGGRPVRLHGIDAPEAGQSCIGADGRDWPCGAWATRQLGALADGRQAVCEELDTDRYGRSVARCRVGGQDLGRALVRAGAATAYRRYSDAYVWDETEARRAARGVWQGTMLPPEAHRAATRAEIPEAPLAGCAIKGNISAAGQIYHLPGQTGYRRTRINEARGERWFCSEAEARAAGWRRARN